MRDANLVKIANRDNRDFAIWPKMGFLGSKSSIFDLLGPSFDMLCIFSLVFRKISLEVISSNLRGHFGPKTGFSGYTPIYGNGPALGAPMGVCGPNWFQMFRNHPRVTPMPLTLKSKI